MLKIVYDYSSEIVAQLASVSIKGNQVVSFLDEIRELSGIPKNRVCDNGAKYAGKVMFFWSKESGVWLSFIQPGKPAQNAFVERPKTSLETDV